MTLEAQQQAFLKTVIENPSDYTPRLVYADWLDEFGVDPARAEFIRTQMQMRIGFEEGVTCPFSQETTYQRVQRGLWLRCAELLLYHRYEWIKETGTKIPTELREESWAWVLTWRGGFVEKIRLRSYADWDDYWKALRANLPLRQVTFTRALTMVYFGVGVSKWCYACWLASGRWWTCVRAEGPTDEMPRVQISRVFGWGWPGVKFSFRSPHLYFRPANHGEDIYLRGLL